MSERAPVGSPRRQASSRGDARPTRSRPHPDAPVAARGGPLSARGLAGLQRSAGNRATAALLGPVPVVHVQREWNPVDYEKTDREGYQSLLAMCGGVGANAKSKTRGRLAELAKRTDTPAQLRTLLTAFGQGKQPAVAANDLLKLLETAPAADLARYLKLVGDGAKVLALVERAGGIDKVATLFSAVTTPETLDKVLALDSDPDALAELHKTVGEKPFLGMLQQCPPASVGRARYILGTIAAAGGFEALSVLRAYSTNIGELRALLDRAPAADLLRHARTHGTALQGKSIAELLAFGDLATAVSVTMAPGNKGRPLAELKVLVSEHTLSHRAAGYKMHPKAIRFTQSQVTQTGAGYTVKDNIRKLREEPGWEIPGAIRVFVKTSGLRTGPQHTQFGIASSDNLEDGAVYALDNRRLYAYREAGREHIAAQFVGEDVARRESFKFTTDSAGHKASLW